MELNEIITDAEVSVWVENKIAEFKIKASGCGFEALLAAEKLKQISTLAEPEKIRIGREHLNIQK